MWMLVLLLCGGTIYAIMRWQRGWRERKEQAEARLAAFVAQAMPGGEARAAAAPAEDPTLPQQRLLLEAATKAGQAGEPVLSIQLYAKLLSRYPATAFAAQARAAVEEQKRKLAKA